MRIEGGYLYTGKEILRVTDILLIRRFNSKIEVTYGSRDVCYVDINPGNIMTSDELQVALTNTLDGLADTLMLDGQMDMDRLRGFIRVTESITELSGTGPKSIASPVLIKVDNITEVSIIDGKVTIHTPTRSYKVEESFDVIQVGIREALK